MHESWAAPPPPSVFPPITPFSFSSSTGSALRKQKSVQNCSACRRRKTKCDRLWPCTPCKDRGEANLCEQYVKEPSDRPTGYTHVLDTSILANRVTQLEYVLSRLLTRKDDVDAYQDLLYDFKDPLPTYKPNKESEEPEPKRQKVETKAETDAGSSMTNRRLSTTSIAPSMSSVAAMAPPPSGQTPLGSTTSPIQLMSGMARQMFNDNPGFTQPMPALGSSNLPLGSSSSTWGTFDSKAPPLGDSFALHLLGGGRSGGRSTEPGSKAPSAHEHDAALALEGMALGREVLNIGTSSTQADDTEATPGSPITFTSFVQNKQSTKPSNKLKSFPSVNLLPNLIVGKYLVNNFLENVHFRWPCLHRPSFEDLFEKLSARLRSQSTDFTRDELSTLALYASCLTVGVHFLEDEGYRDLNLNVHQAEEVAATCWKVSYEALEASDWMQVHDIRSCQTIVIAGIYLSSVRRANQHWTLLGSVTKVAMALGLASVPDERQIISGQLRRIPPRWSNAIDREVARRVWFCLLELDWLFSMEYGFLYLISPEIHHTTEPANANDSDIKADEPVVSMPTNTHTEMSYFLQRLKIFYPFQGVVQKARKAGRMRYAFIIEANEALQQAIRDVPSFYRTNEQGIHAADAVELHKIKRETVALREGSDLRLMRLHRYYFSAACTNPRYLLSKEICLSCARSTLDMAKNSSGNHYTNMHYWGHTYSLFAATMVCIIYTYYALPQELEEIKTYAELGIGMLRSLQSRQRTDTGDTTDTLQGLLNLQLSRRADNDPEPPKRDYNEFGSDPWEGWLPPDLVAHLNPSLIGDTTQGQGQQTDPATGMAEGFLFDSLLDDFQLSGEGNYMIL